MVILNRRYNRIISLKCIGNETDFKHKPDKASYQRLVEHNQRKIFLSLFICIDNQAF
jgi:hypothetical protein